MTFTSSLALTLVFVTMFFAPAASAVAAGGGLEFKIPPTRIPLNIKNQPVTIVASGLIAMVASGRETSTFRVQLAGDLSDLQRNITPLLSSQLDKDDHCGEHIEIQNATLGPAPPAIVGVVELRYGRRACVKVFGKEKSKTLVAGNATIQLKLTPVGGPTILNCRWSLKSVPSRPMARWANCCVPDRWGRCFARRFALRCARPWRRERT